MFFRIILLIICFAFPAFAGDIKALKSDSSFEEVAHIDKLDQIKISETPRTAYTPKNLRTQYQISFQGRNTETGAYTYWSNPIVDYDTKIVDSEVDENGDYYIIDNTGKKIKSGEHTDLTSVNTQITKINNQVNSNTESLEILGQKMNQQKQNIYTLNKRVDKLETRINKGLASVTALNALKSNPRSNANCELSVGVGMYRNNSAIATGLIYHFNNNIMLHGGVSYGGEDSTVGYGGATFNLF